MSVFVNTSRPHIYQIFISLNNGYYLHYKLQTTENDHLRVDLKAFPSLSASEKARSPARFLFPPVYVLEFCWCVLLSFPYVIIKLLILGTLPAVVLVYVIDIDWCRYNYIIVLKSAWHILVYVSFPKFSCNSHAMNVIMFVFIYHARRPDLVIQNSVNHTVLQW